MNHTICLITFLLLIGVRSSCQKITVFFDRTSTSIPIVSKAPLKYNKDFAYSFTLDDATSDAFFHALPLFQGGYIKETGVTYPGLFFTDGCGNDINFKCGIAWNSVNAAGIDIHTGEVAGLLTWQQLDSLYNLGWDIFNHSFSHKSKWTSNMTTSDYNDEVIKNQIRIREKTAKKVETPVFVVPSGDATYQDIALQLGHKIVFDQSGNVTGFGGIQVDDILNLNNLKLHRQLLEESLFENSLNKSFAKTLSGGHYWYNEFTHRIDDFQSTSFNFYSFKNQMQRIADLWGKNGTDKVWMAPLQEVFEYLVFKQTLRYTTSISDKKLEINLDLSNIPTWLRRKTITFIIDTPSPFTKIDTPKDVKASFNGTSNTKILNLDLTNYSSSNNTTPIQDIAPPSVLKLYPNPSSDVLNIDISDFSLYPSTTLSIDNAMGQTLMQLNPNHTHSTIDIHKLPKGIYWVVLKQGDKKHISKWVKL